MLESYGLPRAESRACEVPGTSQKNLCGDCFPRVQSCNQTASGFPWVYMAS